MKIELIITVISFLSLLVIPSRLKEHNRRKKLQNTHVIDSSKLCKVIGNKRDS